MPNHDPRSPERRHEEQSLLLEVMLLALSADGVIDAAEVAELARTVGELPEFRGYSQEAVQRSLASAFAMLDRQGATPHLESIAGRLGDTRSRLLAYALARRMCLADARIPAAEANFLAKLRAAFELPDAQVDRLDATLRLDSDLRALVDWVESSA